MNIEIVIKMDGEFITGTQLKELHDQVHKKFMEKATKIASHRKYLEELEEEKKALASEYQSLNIACRQAGLNVELAQTSFRSDTLIKKEEQNKKTLLGN